MYEQINDQFLNFGRNAVDSLVKANVAAAKGFEKIVGIHMGAAEASLNETAAFLTEAGSVRDAEAAKDFLPKGFALAKANFERAYGATRDAIDVTVKTGEELSAAARDSFEKLSTEAKKATKAASK